MGSRSRGSDEPARVLVIGCGFLGGHIACGLARRGVRVRVLSRSFTGSALRALPSDVLIRSDARNRLALETALIGIDEVVYCIGGLQPASAELNPDLDAWMLLSPLRDVVAALALRPGTALTYLSSGGAVYGNPDCLPVTEDAPTRPIGAYASVRLAGERVLIRAHEHYGLDVRVLRCANVYGEGQPIDRGQGAVAVFLDRIWRGETIEVFGDGGVIRDYVYVGDLVEVASRLLGLRGGVTLLNVGSGSGTSVNQLIDLLETALGRKAITVPRPHRGFDVRAVVLDIERMRRLVSLDPRGLSEGIALLLAGRQPSFPQADALLAAR